jgi:hypothetical protein
MPPTVILTKTANATQRKLALLEATHAPAAKQNAQALTAIANNIPR